MDSFIFLAVSVFIHLHFWFFLAVLKKRNDFADIAWGTGFPLLAGVQFFLVQEAGAISFRSMLIFILICLWGLRLASYMALRVSQTTEDHRYVKMRNDWGQNWKLQTYFKVFVLQSLLMVLIASGPLYMIRNFSNQTDLNVWDFIFSAFAILGLIIEGFSDWQKFQFKKDPSNRGKIIRLGFWKHARHPNYFGEMVFWFSIAAFSFHQPSELLSGLWWVWLCPALLSFLLLRVSGVPLHAKEETPEYKKYKEETNLLFPFKF